MTVKPPANMVDPAGRECRCQKCGLTQWVDGPLAPTVGIVCDICRQDPCPNCGGAMRPTHPYVFQAFDEGATNASVEKQGVAA